MEYSKYSINRIAFVSALFFILCILLSFPSICVYADNPGSSVTPIYTVVGSEKVYVLNVDGLGNYLFLPTETDTSYISLYSINGEKILFKDEDVLSEGLDISHSAPNEKSIYETDILIVPDPDDIGLSETVHLNIMKGENVGSVYYNSNDIDNKGMRWVDANRNNRGTGSVVITDQYGDTIYDGSIEDIHIRGSSAIIAPKKSYQIKLSKKTALVGTEKGKKWVLLAMYYDPLRISDKIMKDIANVSNDKYSAKEALVNLYYDGAYRGVYNLSEKNEIKSNRIDITDMEEYYENQYSEYGDTANLSTSKNKYNNTIQYDERLEGPATLGGYLIEMNASNMDSSNGFLFTANGHERAVTISSPELGSRKAVIYISEYFQDFSNAIYGSEENKMGWNPDTGLFYYDYCDLDSLVNSYLLQTISSNGDGFWRSQFFYKDVDEKMYSGPMWDMDNTFGMLSNRQADPYEDVLTSQAISGGLIKIPSFRNELKERYFAHYQGIMASLLGEDDKVSSFMDMYETVKKDLLMDAVLWPVKYKTHDGSSQWAENESLDVIAKYRVDWIRKHKEYLDTYFGNIDELEENSHIYGEAVPENSEYHKRVCAKCGDVLLCSHAWDEGEVTAPATCTADGVKTFTCTGCGATKTETINALGHDWSEPEWKWAEDHSGASAKITCKNDASHTESVNAEVTTAVDESGNTVYTAKASIEGKEYTDTITEEQPQEESIRIYGSDRYDTAIKAADEYKAATNSKFKNVVVAYGQDFPDALAGGYFAKVKNAPILLVKTSVENQIVDYISKNIASGGTVYILGGTGVVSSSFEKKVKAKGITTERLGGKDRYETNRLILQAAGVTNQDILVCTGKDYADSLSASAIGLPILLVDKNLKQEQKTYLNGLSTGRFYLIGGEGAVNHAIESELRGLGYSNIERIAGKTRYETSTEVAKKFFPKVRTVMLAYAKNFPDGLSGGPLAMINGSPIILTDSKKTAAAQAYVRTAEAIRSITLGGISLISDPAVRAIMGS